MVHARGKLGCSWADLPGPDRSRPKSVACCAAPKRRVSTTGTPPPASSRRGEGHQRDKRVTVELENVCYLNSIDVPAATLHERYRLARWPMR